MESKIVFMVRELVGRFGDKHCLILVTKELWHRPVILGAYGSKLIE